VSKFLFKLTYVTKHKFQVIHIKYFHPKPFYCIMVFLIKKNYEKIIL